MVVLLDTSVLIEHEKGAIDLAAKLLEHHESRGMISAITVSELLHGVHRAKEPRIRDLRRTSVEALIAQFQTVVFDSEIARVHARISAELARRGTPVGAYDLIVAATALAVDIPVATANVKDFRRVSGLSVLHW